MYQIRECAIPHCHNASLARYDHTIRFWEATTGLCYRTIQHGESQASSVLTSVVSDLQSVAEDMYALTQVNKLEITADKQFLAAAGNPQVRLFEVNSNNPQPLITYEKHTNNVSAVRFQFGRLNVLVSVHQGKHGVTLGMHAQVGFQKDSKWMYTGSEDGGIKIWDLRAPNCQREYSNGPPINTLVLHPNQGELISGTPEK